MEIAGIVLGIGSLVAEGVKLGAKIAHLIKDRLAHKEEHNKETAPAGVFAENDKAAVLTKDGTTKEVTGDNIGNAVEGFKNLGDPRVIEWVTRAMELQKAKAAKNLGGLSTQQPTLATEANLGASL